LDRLALISDIHGNIPALEAVLWDIRKRRIKRIFCLGDLVGKGPHPEKAIDICRSESEIVIIGNWDEAVSSNASHPLVLWQRRRLDEKQLDYLKNLPNIIEFWLSGRKIRLFHASQLGVTHRVHRNAPDDVHLAMFSNTDFTKCNFAPDVIGYADIHIVFLKEIQEKILFNIGSVGNPLDYPQASYAILEGNYDSNKAGVFSINMIRVPYNIELSVSQAASEGLPDLEQYASELRTAVYRGDPSLHQ
jgi:protein phosphatase